jgi:glycosidase
VLNHTSTANPWFQASVDPESEYHNWYVWSETNPQIPGPWFQDVWHRNNANQMYYYGVFWGGMPDLNYDNPDVSTEMLNVSKFWLEDVGVDGFRVDAARYLFAEGSAQQDTATTIQWFEDWRAFYKPINPNAFTVGEVWASLFVISKYAQGMDSLFMFDLAEDIKGSVYSPNPSRVIQSYLDILANFPEMNFSTFLSNHDQQRVMAYYREDSEKAKLAAFVYLTGPGSPFIYYGEEIGMIGDKPDEKIRTPMQWTGEPGAGFTTGTPWEPLNNNYKNFTVALQDEDPDSLLNQYRALVNLRNQYPALRTGEYLPFTSSCRQVYALLRVEGDEALLVIANLSQDELAGCTISIEKSPLTGEFPLTILFGDGEFIPIVFAGDGSVINYELPSILAPGEQFIFHLDQ